MKDVFVLAVASGKPVLRYVLSANPPVQISENFLKNIESVNGEQVAAIVTYETGSIAQEDAVISCDEMHSLLKQDERWKVSYDELPSRLLEGL